MAKCGCPPKFIAIARLLHDGMMTRVQDDENSSASFLVSNDTCKWSKIGCALAPTLLSLMFSAMLTNAFADTDIALA